MTKQQYFLLALMEECNELAQVCSKAIRFGLDDFYDKHGKSNYELMVDELNDIVGVISALQEEGVPIASIAERIELKVMKLERWDEYSKTKGCVE